MRPNKYPPRPVIHVDVDGTLVTRGKLNRELAEWSKRMKEKGFELTLWSAQGKEYCERIAKEHDVENCFDYFASKPSFIVDDLGWSWTKYTKVMHDLVDLNPIKQR